MRYKWRQLFVLLPLVDAMQWWGTGAEISLPLLFGRTGMVRFQHAPSFDLLDAVQPPRVDFLRIPHAAATYAYQYTRAIHTGGLVKSYMYINSIMATSWRRMSKFVPCPGEIRWNARCMFVSYYVFNVNRFGRPPVQTVTVQLIQVQFFWLCTITIISTFWVFTVLNGEWGGGG